jgi:hypothetical protein
VLNIRLADPRDRGDRPENAEGAPNYGYPLWSDRPAVDQQRIGVIHGWMSLGRSSRTVEPAAGFKRAISLVGGSDVPYRMGPARFLPCALADESESGSDLERPDPMTSQRKHAESFVVVNLDRSSADATAIGKILEPLGIPIEVVESGRQLRWHAAVVLRIPEDRAADAMLALAMKGFGDVTAYQAGGAGR